MITQLNTFFLPHTCVTQLFNQKLQVNLKKFTHINNILQFQTFCYFCLNVKIKSFENIFFSYQILHYLYSSSIRDVILLSRRALTHWSRERPLRLRHTTQRQSDAEHEIVDRVHKISAIRVTYFRKYLIWKFGQFIYPYGIFRK